MRYQTFNIFNKSKRGFYIGREEIGWVNPPIRGSNLEPEGPASGMEEIVRDSTESILSQSKQTVLLI